MKKMCKKYVLIWITLLLIISLFQSFIWVSASNDKVSEVTEYYKNIHNANKLASWGIIVDNSVSPEKYRLNDSISRWEMAKIISKISKIEVIDKCELKYNDLLSSDWECKYAEAWLKNSYFSAENTYFRPKDSITKIEALKIVMKAKWIEKTDNSDWKKAYVEAWEKAGILNYLTVFNDYDSVAQRWWIFNLVSKNIWNVLIQWDFKAEYFWSWHIWWWKWNNYKNSDYINVTIDWNIYKIPWIYNTSTISCNNEIRSKAKDLETIYSACWWVFYWFEEFSPSWYYLLFSYVWWEHYWLNMIDSKTWKEIMSIFYPNFFSRTKDRKQFIYWWEDWMWTDRWLYITIKWSFPETKLVLDENISAWYIDEKNIYLVTNIYEEEFKNFIYYKKIIDINSEKVIFSKKIEE